MAQKQNTTSKTNASNTSSSSSAAAQQQQQQQQPTLAQLQQQQVQQQQQLAATNAAIAAAAQQQLQSAAAAITAQYNAGKITFTAMLQQLGQVGATTAAATGQQHLAPKQIKAAVAQWLAAQPPGAQFTTSTVWAGILPAGTTRKKGQGKYIAQALATGGAVHVGKTHNNTNVYTAPAAQQ